MGIFYPYIAHDDVQLIGVEAGGDGIETGRHAASLTAGRPGVLHGNRTYLMQDANGQIIETHSVSAGLDYPGVGPEHAWLKDTGPRAVRNDHRRPGSCRIPRLLPDRRHHSRPRIGARAGLRGATCGNDAARQDPAGESFRSRRQGHEHRRATLGSLALMNRIDAAFAKLRAAGRTALIPYVTSGDPSPSATVPIMRQLVAAGADIIELGVPFSDPMADGPVIQRASERALAQGVGLQHVLSMVAEFRAGDASTPVVLMGYANPIENMGAA
jgi:hypothetical protein